MTSFGHAGKAKVFGILIQAFLFAVSPLAEAASANSDINQLPFKQTKKVIDFAWSAPSARFVAGNIKSMQTKPFDGVVFYPGNKRIELFNPTAWSADKNSIDTKSLSKIRWGKWKGSNFFLVWSSDNWNNNYWDDKSWSVIAANMAALAKAAKKYGCAGFLLDTESYSDRCPWSLRDQARGHSTVDTQNKVRQRGREFMRACQSSFPNITILATFLLGQGKSPENNELLAYFVNGMLDVLNPKATLVEGGEEAYYWNITEQWYSVYNSFKFKTEDTLGYLDPKNKAKWFHNVQLSKAVYYDGVMSGKQTAAQYARFVHNCYTGMETCDQYLWVYSEKANWFGVPISEQPMGNEVDKNASPKAAVRGLEKARALFRSGAGLGYDMYSNDLWAGAQVDHTVTVKLSDVRQVNHGKTARLTMKVLLNRSDVTKIDIYLNSVKISGTKRSGNIVTIDNIPQGEYRIIILAELKNARWGTSNVIRIKVGTN